MKLSEPTAAPLEADGVDQATTMSGFVLAGAALPLTVLASDGHLDFSPMTLWGVVAAACCVLLVAALTLTRVLWLGRVLTAAAAVTTLALFLPSWQASPAATLVALILTSLGMSLLFGTRVPLEFVRRHFIRPRSGFLGGAALSAWGLWIVWVARGAPMAFFELAPLVWAGAVTLAFGLRRAFERRKAQRHRVLSVLFGYVTTAGLVLLFRDFVFWWISLPIGLGVATAWILRRPHAAIMGEETWWEPFLGHPERLFVGTFAFLSIVGGFALSTPIAVASEGRVSALDAFFTSTSAVCVTGLITIDPPHDLSLLGQGIVLLLIQIGGLGIMTFSTAVLWAMGRRLSLRHEGAVASLISTHDRGQLFANAKRILWFTGITEAAGAFVLLLLFVQHGDSWGMALWRGVFTSISAFCNAGFALQSTSLMPYQSSPLILHTVGLLIILGGLSPLAVFALVPILSRSVTPVHAQAKLCLVAAAILLGAGFCLFAALEWESSLSGLSLADKLHNAWFQSVTLRTAGFNSVDLSLIQPATLTWTSIWMFIGGSPGGTAGGVKTTTVAIMALSVLQSIRGRSTIEVFGRTIPERVRARAAVVLVIAAFSGFVALLVVQLTQQMSNRLAFFEVVSALGTVGLSIGGTAQLDSVGQFVIIFCMFIGRVGGLTLLMFLSTRTFVPKVGRPEEEVDVG